MIVPLATGFRSHPGPILGLKLNYTVPAHTPQSVANYQRAGVWASEDLYCGLKGLLGNNFQRIQKPIVSMDIFWVGLAEIQAKGLPTALGKREHIRHIFDFIAPWLSVDVYSCNVFTKPCPLRQNEIVYLKGVVRPGSINRRKECK